MNYQLKNIFLMFPSEAVRSDLPIVINELIQKWKSNAS